MLSKIAIYSVIKSMAVVVLENALSVGINLGKNSFFLWLFVSRVKTGVVQVAQ